MTLLLQTGISRLIKLPCFFFSASARPQYCSPGLSVIFAPFVVCSSSARSTPRLWSVSGLQEACFANLLATVDSRLGGHVTLAPASSQGYRREWSATLKLSKAPNFARLGAASLQPLNFCIIHGFNPVTCKFGLSKASSFARLGSASTVPPFCFTNFSLSLNTRG